MKKQRIQKLSKFDLKKLGKAKGKKSESFPLAFYARRKNGKDNSFLESRLKQSTPSQPVWNQEAILEKNQLLGAA